MKNCLKNNLKYLRNVNHITQEELGKKLGKDYSTIGKWENGTRSPSMNDTFKISEFFNVPIEKLLLENLTMDNPPIQNNEWDDKVEELETKTGVKISYGKEKQLTQDDYLEINSLLMKEIDKQTSKK